MELIPRESVRISWSSEENNEQMKMKEMCHEEESTRF